MFLSFTPNMSLFMSSMILGTLMSLSSNNIILIWIGLEINMISFIPILITSSSNQEASAIMKYFLMQSMASGLLLLAMALSSWPYNYMMSNSSLLFFLALMMKLGLPPCHFWFPSVMSSLNWMMCLILTTWQKITPIMFMLLLMPNSNLIIMLLLLSATISSLGGLNQSQLRPLLAYSSIGHMTWMLSANILSISCAFIYFMFYILISIPMFLILWNSSSFSFNSMKKMKMNFSSLMILMLLIFSLSGLPPFTGFFPKWLSLEFLNFQTPLIASFLLLSSMINLSYYLNFSFMSYFSSLSFSNKFKSSNIFILFMIILSILSLPMLFI